MRPRERRQARSTKRCKTLKASPSIDHWQKHRERWEADELLIHVLGEESDPDDDVPAKARRRFEAMVERRATGEPIPFIKGYAEFRGLELIAEPGVFVPRDSSEFLAEQAVRRLRRRKAPVAVDLATGGGTIALAVANEVPKAAVYGTDVSDDAVKLARKNAKRLGLRATFRVGDLFGGAARRSSEGSVDVITLHPPYVADDEIEELPDEIREWEPVHTLTDRSDDGLGLIRRTVDEAPAWLGRRGWLLMEVDPDRARDVMPIYRRGGFRDVKSTKGGALKVTRVIVGRRPRERAATVAPYGTWRSPISAAMLVEGGVSLEPRRGSRTERRTGSRARPSEGGRVGDRPRRSRRRARRRDAARASTPGPRCTSTAAASFVVHRGVVFSSNFADQRLYRHDPGQRADADHAGDGRARTGTRTGA